MTSSQSVPPAPSSDPFHRIKMLLGEGAFARLQNAFVTIIGLGAVGSYAAEALVRAGVGHLRLVDFDTVHPSNLNRQLFALHSTLGQRKIDAAKHRLLDIHPGCRIETLQTFVHEESFEAVLAGPPDLVIDAIDSFNPKVALLTELVRRTIPVISSMGAALRLDPCQVRVAPLEETRICPLAQKIRKRLRRNNAMGNILCVFSTESLAGIGKDALCPASESEPGSFRRGRERRTLGSLPTVTGIFGLTAAHAAIQHITGFPSLKASSSSGLSEEGQ